VSAADCDSSAGCDNVARFARRGPNVVLPLLDRMLPTVPLDLPAPVSERVEQMERAA
jgi:hypothetical protein